MTSIAEGALAYVQHEVLGYLSRRPRACDTIDGIIDWWLFEQRHALGRQTVLQAVEGLVTAGRLAERRKAGGVILYALPSSRQE